MKRSELAFTALLVPLDLAMIIMAFLAAYNLRLSLGDVNFVWPFNQYLTFVGILSPFWLLIFAFLGLYSIKTNRRAWEEFASLFIGVCGGTFLVIAWPFLTRQEFFSRLVVIYLFIFALIFLALGRFIVRAIQELLYKYGIGVRSMAIVGVGSVAADFAQEICSRSDYGIKVTGIIQDRVDAEIQEGLEKIKLLGNIKEFEQIIKHNQIDQVLIACQPLPRTEVLEMLEICEASGIDLMISPSLLDVHSTNIGVTQVAGVPIIEYKRTPLEGWGHIYKRALDILGSLFGITIFSPFMILTAIAVKLTSKGPIIYRNERVGDSKNFYAYKFRSMKIEYSTGNGYGGDKALEYEQKLIESRKNTRKGPLYKIKDDPRLTPIGAFIRATSLDELPQFFNVLKGEMSLVGPRPHQPREVEKYERRHRMLLHVKPGLTGLAQISGRSDLDFEDEYRIEHYYIENWSIWLDLQIIIKTPFVLLASRNRKAA